MKTQITSRGHRVDPKAWRSLAIEAIAALGEYEPGTRGYARRAEGLGAGSMR